MSAQQHTPGPWKKGNPNDDWRSPYREDNKTSVSLNVEAGSGEVIAMAVICYDEWTNKEKDAELKANARLIAAAPELLAVLLEAVEQPMRTEGSDWWVRVNAAIGKATGEQP